jgi:hypothetical protein
MRGLKLPGSTLFRGIFRYDVFHSHDLRVLLAAFLLSLSSLAPDRMGMMSRLLITLLSINTSKGFLWYSCEAAGTQEISRGDHPQK